MQISKEEIKVYQDLYHKDRSLFHQKIFQESPQPYQDLYPIYQAISQNSLQRYLEEGIDLQIFKDTMSDIEVWALDQEVKTGQKGIKEYLWIEKSLDLEIFKLGRLQFSLDPQQEEGRLTLEVHIQAGQKLDPQTCQASYRQAVDFFKKRSPHPEKIHQVRFTCDSWLLEPKLQEILDPSSNILAFQKPYQILSKDPHNRQIEERVFGAISDQFESYPDQTQLQSQLKKALLQGHKFGTAKGYFILEVASDFS